jgi:hypothetical protein
MNVAVYVPYRELKMRLSSESFAVAYSIILHSVTIDVHSTLCPTKDSV